MKRYKVLNFDLKSPYQEFQFKIGKKYHCDNFDTNKNHDCSNEFYATKLDGLIYAFNIKRKVFEVRVGGEKVEINQYKMRYENIEILREVPRIELKELIKPLDKKLKFKYSEAMFPINPLLLPRKKLMQKHKDLLREWASVRDSVGASVRDSVWDSVGASVGASVWDSVGASVWDSVWASVGASVRDSVRDSVWDSVGASVWDSVWAYMSSLFPNIKQWKYIEHKKGINPFQSCIDLWNDGFVPSFDGKFWRLHQGKDVKVIYEIKKGEL
jgi:hypothetical protein